MSTAKKILELDNLIKLEPNTYKRGDKIGLRKRRAGGIDDKVSRAFNKQNDPSDIARTAVKFGMDKSEVLRRANKANNLGQFIMVLMNRCRNLQGLTAKGEAKIIKGAEVAPVAEKKTKKKKTKKAKEKKKASKSKS